MFRNRVISSVVAASLMAAVSGFAFAADTGGAAPAATPATKAEVKHAAVLTKHQIADIRKECKEANRKDMKAFHKCVKEKEDAAKSGT